MKLCVIAGDGIGQEVVPQAVRVLQSLLPALQTVTADAGWATFQQQGTALPDATLAAARDCGAVLFGAVSSPARAVAGYRSPIVQLRRQLGCHANLRPTLSLPGCGLPELDVLIVRENTEDLYVGEEHSDGDTATAIKRITRTASLRVAESAFALAAAAGRRRVTIVHKANILPLTDGLFRDCAREVATRYPQLQVDEMLVDTAALKLAQAPQAFDVLLAPNLYGDILSDLAAAFGGGGASSSLSAAAAAFAAVAAFAGAAAPVFPSARSFARSSARGGRPAGAGAPLAASAARRSGRVIRSKASKRRAKSSAASSASAAAAAARAAAAVAAARSAAAPSSRNWLRSRVVVVVSPPPPPRCCAACRPTAASSTF